MSLHAVTAGPKAAVQYAEYAQSLRYDSLPPHVIELARHCLIDALGCAIFGRTMPWSRMILAEAVETGSGGPCPIPGEPGVKLHPPQAALVLGAFCHAFELDSLRKPGAGVHPGATVALPAWAMAQSLGASDEELVCAIVAGCEVMFRIGAATLHTPEKIGFHAPGLTGTFGAALACARLLRLDVTQTTNALGIAGSFASGLLAFASAGQGGMVKRLHMGRAAEGGVLAARLASRGFEAPHSVIEGRFGLLDAFCSETAPELLLEGLGTRFEIETLCFKRYACHITAHAPVQCLQDWMQKKGFGGDDIAEIALRGSAKLVSHHSDKEPADLMLAQYSVPFVMALSAYRDPENPESFAPDAIQDARIRDLCQRISIAERRDGPAKGWGVEIALKLRNGTLLEACQDSFLGTPDEPLSAQDIERKFMRLASGIGEDAARVMFRSVVKK